MTEISIGEKENLTNKGTDMQWVAVVCCTIQLVTVTLSSFVPNFRILSQVVAEKYLTENKFTDKHPNKQT